MGYNLSATLCVGATIYDETSDILINENFKSEEHDDSIVEYLEDNKELDMSMEISGSEGAMAYTLAISSSITEADWSGRVVDLDKYTDKKLFFQIGDYFLL